MRRYTIKREHAGLWVVTMAIDRTGEPPLVRMAAFVTKRAAMFAAADFMMGKEHAV